MGYIGVITHGSILKFNIDTENNHFCVKDPYIISRFCVRPANRWNKPTYDHDRYDHFQPDTLVTLQLWGNFLFGVEKLQFTWTGTILDATMPRWFKDFKVWICHTVLVERLVVSNIFYFHPGTLGKMNPNWVYNILFSNGLVQPPTRNFILQTRIFRDELFGSGRDWISVSFFNWSQVVVDMNFIQDLREKRHTSQIHLDFDVHGNSKVGNGK